jgi:hypothetical protein
MKNNDNLGRLLDYTKSSERKRHLYFAAALRLDNQHTHIADLIDKYLNKECSKKDLNEAILAETWGYADNWIIRMYIESNIFGIHKLVEYVELDYDVKVKLWKHMTKAYLDDPYPDFEDLNES